MLKFAVESPCFLKKKKAQKFIKSILIPFMKSANYLILFTSLK